MMAVDSASCIREASQNDSDEITRLCIQLGYSVSRNEIAARMLALQETERHFIAVACGPGTTLLGWIVAEHRMLLESGERVEIVGLVVDRTARRNGIGRELVFIAESWTREKGLSTIFVRSNVIRNASHRFYEGIGYGRAKTQHAYSKNVKAV